MAGGESRSGRNFGIPGGLGKDTFIAWAKMQYKVDIAPDEFDELKRIWLEAFPEMALHLKPPEDPKHPGMYIGQTITGRIRANCPFCAAANYA